MRWQQNEWSRTGRQYAVGHPAAAATAQEPATWSDYPALRDHQVEMAEYSPPKGTAHWGPAVATAATATAPGSLEHWTANAVATAATATVPDAMD